jgi:hypothetical protein
LDATSFPPIPDDDVAALLRDFTALGKSLADSFYATLYL